MNALVNQKNILFASAGSANLSVDVNSLDVKKVSNDSAHTVVEYQTKNKQSTYFAKLFNRANQQRQLENAIAEITYSRIWRFLLGERASESGLLIDNRQIIGICSKALPGFTEFQKVQTEDKLKGIFGLASLVLFSYLLMENDLHVRNYGLTFIDSTPVWGKIDHDYICAHDLQSLQKNFPLLLLKLFIQRKNSQSFFQLCSQFRFSPLTSNSLILRTLHSMRTMTGSGSKTTLSKNDVNRILINYFSTKNTLYELEAAIEYVKNLESAILDKNHANLILAIRNKYNIPDEYFQKAENIYQVTSDRLSEVKDFIHKVRVPKQIDNKLLNFVEQIAGSTSHFCNRYYGDNKNKKFRELANKVKKWEIQNLKSFLKALLTCALQVRHGYRLSFWKSGEKTSSGERALQLLNTEIYKKYRQIVLNPQFSEDYLSRVNQQTVRMLTYKDLQHFVGFSATHPNAT